MSETLEKPVAETARPMSPISRRFGRNDDAAFNRIMARIDELGLNRNLLELETVGYTVVPVLSEDRIERAKQEWEDGAFGTIPGDDKEFIPLPQPRQDKP